MFSAFNLFSNSDSSLKIEFAASTYLYARNLSFPQSKNSERKNSISRREGTLTTTHPKSYSFLLAYDWSNFQNFQKKTLIAVETSAALCFL